MSISIARRFLPVLLALALLGSIALTVTGAGPEGTLELDRWVMSGGQTTGTDGTLAIEATVGQPAVGLSGSAPLDLMWGYWPGGTYRMYLPLLLKN